MGCFGLIFLLFACFIAYALSFRKLRFELDQNVASIWKDQDLVWEKPWDQISEVRVLSSFLIVSRFQFLYHDGGKSPVFKFPSIERLQRVMLYSIGEKIRFYRRNNEKPRWTRWQHLTVGLIGVLSGCTSLGWSLHFIQLGEWTSSSILAILGIAICALGGLHLSDVWNYDERSTQPDWIRDFRGWRTLQDKLISKNVEDSTFIHNPEIDVLRGRPNKVKSIVGFALIGLLLVIPFYLVTSSPAYPEDLAFDPVLSSLGLFGVTVAMGVMITFLNTKEDEKLLHSKEYKLAYHEGQLRVIKDDDVVVPERTSWLKGDAALKIWTDSGVIHVPARSMLEIPPSHAQSELDAS